MWIPVVDLKSCIGCGDCTEVCPDNAIAIVEKKASIDYAKCTCCGVCDRVCQNGALEMKIPQMPSVLDKGVQRGAFKAEMTILKLELKEMMRDVRP